MWNIAALTNGEWTQVEAMVIENGLPPSLAAVHGQASRMTNASRLLEFLNSELTPGKNVVSAHDAIELWAEKAALESEEFDWATPGKLERLEEAIAYYSSAPQSVDVRPDTLAWHDHTTVIIPLVSDRQQLMIEYTPSPRDENRVERLQFRYGSLEHRLETIFEAQAYYGTQSAVIAHWRDMRRSGHGYVATLRSSAGFIVGLCCGDWRNQHLH